MGQIMTFVPFLARWGRESSTRLVLLLSFSILLFGVLNTSAYTQASRAHFPEPLSPSTVRTVVDEGESLPARIMPAMLPIQISDYLANPGIGWQESRIGSPPLLPETVAYRRPQYGWVDQNPQEGVYNWSAVDADLQAARSAGQQFSFRIYTMQGESYGGHHVPQWVLNEGAVILSSGEPDYSNCTYQAEWARFVDAMRQKYDGDPDIAFIDVSGYGNFNEWSWQDQTEFQDTTLDGQARKRLADMFIGGSGSTQCRTQTGQTQTVSYSYTGFQHTQLLMPFAGIRKSSEYVASRRSDVGIRHDCLGSTSHTDVMLNAIGAVIDRTWRGAPIVFEFCSSTTCTEPVMADARAVLQRTHGSAVHDNLVGARSATMLADLLRDVGYRYVLQEATHPASVRPGGSLPLGMKWFNAGYAPAYPRTGQDFELRFYLVSSNGSIVQNWKIDADVSSWMPADPLPGAAPVQTLSQTLTVAPSVAPGTYNAAVAIVEKRTGRPIQLAIDGRDGQGRYLLDDVQVTQDAPTATLPGSTPERSFLPSVFANAPDGGGS